MSAIVFSFHSIFFAVTSSVDRPPVPREIGAYRWFFGQCGRCGRSFANPLAAKKVGVNRYGCLLCHRNKLLFFEADYGGESSSEASVMSLEASVTTIKTGGFPCLLTLKNTLLAGFVKECVVVCSVNVFFIPLRQASAVVVFASAPFASVG